MSFRVIGPIYFPPVLSHSCISIRKVIHSSYLKRSLRCAWNWGWLMWRRVSSELFQPSSVHFAGAVPSALSTCQWTGLTECRGYMKSFRVFQLYFIWISKLHRTAEELITTTFSFVNCMTAGNDAGIPLVFSSASTKICQLDGWSGINRNSAVLTISLLLHLANQYTIAKKPHKSHGLRESPSHLNTLTHYWANLKGGNAFSMQGQRGHESSKVSIANIFQEEAKWKSSISYSSEELNLQHMSSLKNTGQFFFLDTLLDQNTGNVSQNIIHHSACSNISNSI